MHEYNNGTKLNLSIAPTGLEQPKHHQLQVLVYNDLP